MARKSKQQNESEPAGLSHFDRVLQQKKFEELQGVTSSIDEALEHTERVSTGSLIFDVAIGGGIRSGVSRLVAEPSHGKSSMCLNWMANWLKTIPNSYGVYFNAEGRLSPELIKSSGLTKYKDQMRVISTNIYENVAQIINDLVLQNEDGVRYFFAIDSTDALICKGDLEKSYDESAQIAGGARMASAMCKRVVIHLGTAGCHLCLLSQTRANLAAKAGPGSGGTTESGGKALAFYSSLTGKIDKLWTNLFLYQKESDEEPIGHYCSIKLVKHFGDTKERKIKIPILYGRAGGVWLEKEVADMCQMYGLITRTGGWYESDSLIREMGFPEKLQGEQKVLEFLTKNPNVTVAIEKHFRDTLIGSETTDALVENSSGKE